MSITPVSNEYVYSSLCDELRRYRDYELTSATWYTAMLMAILGFFMTAGENSPLVGCFGVVIKLLALILSTAIWLGSTYSVGFAHYRYKQIRDIASKYESKQVQDEFKFIRDERIMPPRCLIYLVQSLLILVIWIVILIS